MAFFIAEIGFHAERLKKDKARFDLYFHWEYDEVIQKSKTMKEDDFVYIFPCFRYTSVFYRKGNYERHIPYHQEISGADGLVAIEETLINPDCITEYSEKNKLGAAVKKTEVFYRKIAPRKTVQGKSVVDHWKVITV